MADQKPAERPMVLKDYIAKSRSQVAQVLPRHITPEKQLRLAMLAAYRTPRLQECEALTVVSAIVDASRLGLEIGREAHLVPYKVKKRTVCQMIPDFKGLVKLALQSGYVRAIHAAAVYEGDVFSVREGTDPGIHHAPDYTATRDDDHLIAVYAVAFMRENAVQFAVMPRAEIEGIRNRSAAGTKGPWITDFAEMAKKTVVKRLSKMLPASTELAEAIERDHKAEMGELGEDLDGRPLDERRTDIEDLAEELGGIAGEYYPDDEPDDEP